MTNIDELAAELADFDQVDKATTYSTIEERVIGGFEDIQRFYTEHGRCPEQSAERDLFERLYAVRLERLRTLTAYHALLADRDPHGLLTAASDAEALVFDFNELPVDEAMRQLTDLHHVRSAAERKAAEDIANRTPCADFKHFKHLFRQVQRDLKAGLRTTRPFGKQAEIAPGRYFILDGHVAYVAEMGAEFTHDYGDRDARLRVIFDNGTESNLLRRSLQRALTKDEAGRRITEPDAGPLFADQVSEDDQASGTIYVLRSHSELPLIAQHRDMIHKIGVTGLDVKKRIANAKLDPTFLMADVDIVATYELYNIHRVRLENLLHRLFAAACLEITIMDRFGQPVMPREWFWVPLAVIDDAVAKIRDGSIMQYCYDLDAAQLVRCG
jgi:hypothetical protein